MEQRQAAQARGDEAGAERYGLLALQHERRPQRHVGVHATGMDRRVKHDPEVMSDNGLERQRIQAAAETNDERVKVRAARLEAQGVVVWASSSPENSKSEEEKRKAKLAVQEQWSPLGGRVPRRGEGEEFAAEKKQEGQSEAEGDEVVPQENSQKQAEGVARLPGESVVDWLAREAEQEAQKPDSQVQRPKGQRR